MAGSHFGSLPDGRQVHKWDLRGEDGAGPVIMDFGAVILSMDVPDKDGVLDDVTLGFEDAASYMTDSPYFGAVIGRYANRIAQGRFQLDGKTYHLPVNNGPNSLHGGDIGFDKRLWSGEGFVTQNGKGVRLTLISADGDQGYPGEVTVTTSYIWTQDHELIVDFMAKSTAPTPINLTNHAYWNLAGAASAQTVLQHMLEIPAEQILPVNASQIPTGAKKLVAGTAFDFRKAKTIGQDIDAEDQQLKITQGYDHSFILPGAEEGIAAVLHDPGSGRRLTVTTDQPSVHVYTANFLKGAVVGKKGNAYPKRSAIALETQHYADSPNQPGFPDTILRPGEVYKSRTIFAFDVK